MPVLSLTAADMMAEVRAMVSEPATGFYTRAEILRWINMGLVDFANRTKLLRTAATTPTVIGQKHYGLPGDFVRAEKVFYDGLELFPLNDHQLLTYVANRSALDAQGTVESYYFRGAQNSQLCIYLYQVPGAVKDLEIWYEAIPDALVNDSDVPIVNPAWRQAVIAYAARRAHLKQRQHADAREHWAEYMTLVAEAEYQKAVWHKDTPIGFDDESIWSHKNVRW